MNPSFNDGLPEVSNHLSNNALVQMFLKLFPAEFLCTDIVETTNEEIGDNALTTFGEILRFIGVWFFLGTTSGHARRDFWSTHPISP